MSSPMIVLAVLVSLGGLADLAATDAKRRSAFRLPAVGTSRTRRRAGWAATLLPGLFLLFFAAGGGAGFVLWLGATSVAGWALVAVPPDRVIALRADAGRLLDRLAAVVWRVRRGAGWALILAGHRLGGFPARPLRPDLIGDPDCRAAA